MPRTYYTLCVWDAEQATWFDEFGDYSRAAVAEELEGHFAPKRHKQIIKTDGSMADLIAKRDGLAAPKG